VSWLAAVSISAIPRDFEEEVSGMRGYPRYIVRIMEITRMRERGEMSSKVNIDTIARFPYCGAFSTTILV